MFRSTIAAALAAFSLLATDLPAAAQSHQDTSADWVFGLGAYNINDNAGADVAADLRVEYRVGYRL